MVGPNDDQSRTIIEVRSGAQRAKDRVRGPSVLERLAAEERAAAEAEAERFAKALYRRAGGAVRAHASDKVTTTGNGAVCVLGRGRAARNAPLELGGSAPAMEQRKMTLLAKAESRRSSTVFSLAPAGAGKLDEMPERDEFEATDDGARAWMANFFDFLDKNFSSSGGQGRALDQHELRAGFFGEWHARNGHGRIVQWEKEENGYRLQPITSGGEPVVPSVAAVCAFALQVYVYVCVIVRVANARKPSRTQVVYLGRGKYGR